MSLTIYFDGVSQLPNLPVEKDVEILFMTFKLSGCDYDRRILSAIEQSSYKDELFFVDRFGSTLRVDCLSTGSKTALSLYHRRDVVVSGVELGMNVLTETVKYCSVGSLLLPARNYYIECELEDVAVDVMCGGRHFTSLDEFSDYMMEEAPG